MSEMDSREKLEADVMDFCEHFYVTERRYSELMKLLDRQAEITRREWEVPLMQAGRAAIEIEREIAEKKVTELQAKLDQCMESYADAKDSRDYLRAQLEDYDKTHMPLPLDADGVLIRIGDKVDDGTGGGPIKVMSLTYFEDCCDVNACGLNPHLLRHVKPRTIEDVLDRMRYELLGIWAHALDDDMPDMEDEVIAKYAAELRELMGGDA